MNVGFSNLTSLKAQLLATALQTDTDYDTIITSIGLGVAASFERFCNRKFMYVAGAADVAQGDRDHWFVQRYPVTQFTTVNLRYFRSDPWTNISGQPMAADEEKGMIHFGYTLGVRPIQVQIIYNGGFWWEQLEPTDKGYPSQVPADITNNTANLAPEVFNLPNDLLFAWQIQCRKVWEAIDKLGTQIVRVGSNAHNPADVLAGLDLVPEVKGILQQYVRYQLT